MLVNLHLSSLKSIFTDGPEVLRTDEVYFRQVYVSHM
jgi:hypothetical protein